ncbi:peroxide stress protein YaaA [Arthrobacter sp. 260]|uniref:peroxide stress protein YaaA n=1 Tax=Arthrobacter sp. 260 TaxID=2735314 RepID=UPI001490C361|nr:peroxide stress protein YaaA [Arthrobacter sp. 260]
MLILLPPSEGKSPAVKGPTVDLGMLGFPELTEARHTVLDALAAASTDPAAHSILGVGQSLGAEVQRNVTLRDQPAAPAYLIYSGVLYDALGYRTLTPVQRRKAHESVVVVSALWGALGFADAIPAYRLSMSVTLPATGTLSSFWKPRLTAPLGDRSGDALVVDCRSSTYATAWAGHPERTAAVNVLLERDGKRTVVSHAAKHTRGLLARHLLTRRARQPGTPAELLKAARERWTAELIPATPRKPAQLNIILPG